MKKCYIAGKIGDLPKEEYLKKFADAEMKVKDLGFTPVNPTTQPHDHDKQWSSYMKEDIMAMLQCDAVFAMPCWSESPGATIEVSLAAKLGMKVIF